MSLYSIDLPSFSHAADASRRERWGKPTKGDISFLDNKSLTDAIFYYSRDAIFIADMDNRIVRVNDNFSSLVGNDGSDIAGCTVSSFYDIDSFHEFLDSVDQCWDESRAWSGELTLLRKDGTKCLVSLTWQLVRDFYGKAVQSIGFLRMVADSHVDPLTKLPSRSAFDESVQRVIDESEKDSIGFAVLCLDLDRFKLVNDSMGHKAGDSVLQIVAMRLRASLRASDLLCRKASDEFLIYLSSNSDSVVESVAERVLAGLRKPISLGGVEFSINASIGIAIYGRDGNDASTLIKHAESAMIDVKERGRAHFGFFRPAMKPQNALQSMQMEHAMRKGFEEGAFFVVYQPQIDMKTGSIIGAEALLRWRDKERGFVSPAEFIPLAEESGYIVTLGAWVLEQSIRDAASWLKAGWPINISVNVSVYEFLQADLIDRISHLLEMYQLPSTLLSLELTESILLQKPDEAAARMKELDALGIQLAIDDFGTGYSNLAYLKKMPIDKLKVDQSFVRGTPQDEEDVAIVQAVINLGRALKIAVIAEGVEKQEQADLLRSMGCDAYQGYLFAPGMPNMDFKKRLLSVSAAPQLTRS